MICLHLLVTPKSPITPEVTYRFSHARPTTDRFRVKLMRMQQQKRNEEKYFGYEVHCVDCVQVKNTPILIIVQKILSMSLFGVNIR